MRDKVYTAIKKEIRLTVSGIVCKGDKILLLKRSPGDRKNPNKWDLPGGRVRFGESPQDAVIREIHEETSLAVERAFPFEILNHVKKTRRVIHQTIQLVFLIDVKDLSTVKLRKIEHADYIWIGKSELNTINLVFKDRLVGILQNALKEAQLIKTRQ